ncbi:MAG: MgtC/SapB family protein [[Clostridium] scindens]
MAFTMNIQLIYLLRLLGAALCGAMIGYERESHMKMAGIRTHAIVALASSLMMIISKYGFYDILLWSISDSTPPVLPPELSLPSAFWGPASYSPAI